MRRSPTAVAERRSCRQDRPVRRAPFPAVAVWLEIGVGYVELAPLLGNRLLEARQPAEGRLLDGLLLRARAEQPADEREEARLSLLWSQRRSFSEFRQSASKAHLNNS
jgi:hypothetical protein